MASKISKEMSAFKKGTGKNLGNIGMGIFSFILGFAFSFYWGWLMNVILLAFVPIILFTSTIMGAALQSGVAA